MGPAHRHSLEIHAGLLLTTVLTLLAGASALSLAGAGRPVAFAQEAEPTPTVDPLDIPELPEDPTQLDIGRHSYYYNCMPCHGDKGQGLTDEWRAVWEEDHQNCWARGCHAGRLEDGGFPIPTVIPALIVEGDPLRHFATAEALHDYLVETHPPQRPGALPEEEYWALTAYLLTENGRLAPGTELGPAAAGEAGSASTATPAGADRSTPFATPAGAAVAVANDGIATTAVEAEAGGGETDSPANDGSGLPVVGITVAAGLLAGIAVIVIWRGRRPTVR
jgi:hypothetical protein